MAVPGANRTRLGQGMPGGGAALPPGLPLPGGGVTTGAAPAIPGAVRRPVAQATAPTAPSLPVWANSGDPRAAQETGMGLSDIRNQQNRIPNAGSTKNITVALGVLDQVRSGKLNPTKAAKLMQ